MKTQQIFTEVEEIQKKWMLITEEAENGKEQKIRSVEKILYRMDEEIRKIKSMVSGHIFENKADEVHFFKELKPRLISRFIYYSQILAMEASKPAVGDKALRKFYGNELEKMKRFYSENADFWNYYRRGATYLDHKYFVRNAYDLKMKLPLSFYNLDAGFTTSHDQQVSQILADNELEKYIKKEMAKIGMPVAEENRWKSQLIWSPSKVALVELLYALHLMKTFNGGNIELTEIIRTFEKTLNIELPNFHKILVEIKNRKIEPVKFLKSLHENLSRHISDSHQ